VFSLFCLDLILNSCLQRIYNLRASFNCIQRLGYDSSCANCAEIFEARKLDRLIGSIEDEEENLLICLAISPYTRVYGSQGDRRNAVSLKRLGCALTKWNIAGGQCSDWRCWTLSLYLLTTSRCTDQWSVARVVVQTRWRCLVCCRPGSLLYTCRHQCLLDSAVQTVPTSDCHLYSNNTLIVSQQALALICGVSQRRVSRQVCVWGQCVFPKPEQSQNQANLWPVFGHRARGYHAYLAKDDRSDYLSNEIHGIGQI